MPFIAKMPSTPQEYNDYIAYLKDGTIPEVIPSKTPSNWKRKLECWTTENDLLYLNPTKDQPRRRFVAPWDHEFRESLFDQFHVRDRHCSGAATYDKI